MSNAGVASARLRIALDLTPLLGRPTGIGVFTSELVSALSTHPDLDLVGYAASWRGRHDLRRLAPGGLELVPRPMPARPLRAAWSHSELPPLEWFSGPVDLVHGTNFVVPPTRRAKRLVTVHDLTPVRYPELCSDDTLAYPRLIQRAWRRGAWIHTDSAFVADEVRQWLQVRPADAHRVVPVHLGVTPQQHGDPAAGRRRAGAERYVLALGTIEPRKGLVDLVAAFDTLAALGDDELKLVVAGPDGWGIAAFDAALAACRARDRVVRLGWVDDAGRADLLAGAAVLAYPSLYEGFGLPPLEAMSVGVPVVCSDAGPLPEVTGGAAHLVSAGDPESLAVGLNVVLSDADYRAQLVAAGRERAASFRWVDCADALADLYRRITAIG